MCGAGIACAVRYEEARGQAVEREHHHEPHRDSGGAGTLDEVVVEHARRGKRACGRERRGLRFERGVAVPKPGQRSCQHKPKRDLDRIGGVNVGVPVARRGELRLDLLPSGAALFEHEPRTRPGVGHSRDHRPCQSDFAAEFQEC